jgi:murein hydrolase activator
VKNSTFLFAATLMLVVSPANGSLPRTKGTGPSLADRLNVIRGQVIGLEQGLLESLKGSKEAKANIKKIQALMKLQREEQELSKRRISELESTIGELESRRGILRERILIQQVGTRRYLTELARSLNETPNVLELDKKEKMDGPRRRVLANLVEMGLKEVEALKVDLVDADQLESRIIEEKQQLAYLAQELRENEGILEINRQLQADLLRKNHAERVAQLENYRELKTSEAQVEQMIKNFNARVELQEAVHTERLVSKAMYEGAFGQLKGKLPLPVSGRIVTQFGRYFDTRSNLYIFKKGIDIETGKNQPVKAVSAGRVAYSGVLPNFGQIAIVDHGNHFYSLCGHLGELGKKTGDAVAAGETIGVTDDLGTPVYFEIRARNIAVNPLQWVSN